ncbi:MAG TPA: DUF4340 domain-containing protein, partial [Candidatus Glassbacteria bacterium]|nr:DUF4340 domain-containing protein [Candidatus Glassbacteria bacterium]
MGWKGITILLVLVLALGAYLLLQKNEEPAVKPAQSNAEYLLNCPLEDASVMRIVFSDTSYLARRQGLDWYMEEAFRGYRADSTILNHLFRVLNKAPVVSRIATDSLDLAMVSLEPPVLQIVVYCAGGDSTRLHFGALNPTTENIYVRRNNEEKVLLTGKVVGPMLGVNGFLLRAKGLFRFNPYDVAKVRYENSGRIVFSATRSGDDDQWWIDSGKQRLLGDKVNFLRLVKDLYNGQVREFVPAAEATLRETTLASPQRKLVLTDEKGDSDVVLLGDVFKQAAYYRWAGSTLFPDEYLLVDSRLREKMDAFAVDSLKSMRITDFQSGDVNRIEIVSPIDSLVLTADSDTLWRLVYPQQARCKLWQVERILAHLDTLNASAMASPAEYGDDHP